MADPFEKFRETCLYEAHAACPRVIEELRSLGTEATEQGRRRERLGRVGCFSLVAAVVVPFVLVLLAAGSDSGVAMVLVTTPLALVLVLVGLGAYGVRAMGGRPLPPVEGRRHELVSRVLRLLQADMSPTEPVSLRLDLRPEGQDAQLVGTSKTPRGWIVKRYVEPWLTLQGRLVDGTHFRLDMTERAALRSRSKQGLSRMKHKSKRSADTTLRVRLRVKPERYPELERWGGAAGGAVKLPPGAVLKSLDVTADRVDLLVRLTLPWTPRPGEAPSVSGTQVVAMTFLSLYQFLNRARELGKRARTAG